MDDGKFWIIINAILCATFACSFFIGTSYWQDHNKKIVDLIGTGVDPVAAMCAMQDDRGTHPTCII